MNYLSEKGDVFGWGNSEYQQLNSVTDEMQIHTSRKLSFPGLKKVIDIASAGTMCLLLDGVYILPNIFLICCYVEFLTPKLDPVLFLIKQTLSRICIM